MNTMFKKFKKYAVIVLFVIATILSLICTSRVAINYNISDYLDDSTETKVSLEILRDEFGMTCDVQVMIENISIETAKQVKNTLKGIDNVLTVNFDQHSTTYYKDGNALFVLLVNGDEYSTIATTVLQDVETALNDTFDGSIHYGGAVTEKESLRASIEGEIPFILAIALCLVVAIMLLTSQSWIEPLILLLASGVAVLINRGTNVIFGEISYITNAVAAILQLALSIDYSIVLLHSYRKIKETEPNNKVAMLRAMKETVKPISASALTTMAGLLALLFMSMRIGFDIGIVLIKGIVISAIVSLTLLPNLLLLCDKPLQKTSKRHLVLKGKPFCKMSFKASHRIVSIALAAILVGGVLQFFNGYIFTDSNAANTTILNAFGSNNTVIVVYENTANNHENEHAFINQVSTYQTSSGKKALKGYTAHSNTVRELYDVELASRKLEIPASDVESLFAMYHLYQDNQLVTLTKREFARYAKNLLETDADIQDFADAELTKTIQTLVAIDQMMDGEQTASSFHELATTGAMESMNISLFAIQQMYGLYLYDDLADKTVELNDLLYFLAELSQSESADLPMEFDDETKESLAMLERVLNYFNIVMEEPLTKPELRELLATDFGVQLNDLAINALYSRYYGSLGLPTPTNPAVPFLEFLRYIPTDPVLNFYYPLDEAIINLITTSTYIYDLLHTKLQYTEALPTINHLIGTLTANFDVTIDIGVDIDDYTIQQLYIMYFYQEGILDSEATIAGREFIEFLQESIDSNPIVGEQFPADGKTKLEDLCTVDEFFQDASSYTFSDMTQQLTSLQASIQSIPTTGTLSTDKISGVYIKYISNENVVDNNAIEAKDILHFVVDNMNTNEFLSAKITDANRAKIEEAQDTMNRATDLFVSDNYSRMLLSVDLPTESEDSSDFVAYLLTTAKEVFGENAHIAGLMVATYDLQESFDADNLFIAIFTIIAIFLIVMLVFRSISLPIILVSVIQGAIWISMATSLISGPMFFMSYIVATCILMGATIDYGILMSTAYVNHRRTLNKEESLYKALEAAMPTVFTSGLILMICGFVIGLISTQITIATVGFLLGKGTLVSILMITLVLPSILYHYDDFVLKLTIKKKK